MQTRLLLQELSLWGSSPRSDHKTYNATLNSSHLLTMFSSKKCSGLDRSCSKKTSFWAASRPRRSSKWSSLCLGCVQTSQTPSSRWWASVASPSSSSSHTHRWPRRHGRDPRALGHIYSPHNCRKILRLFRQTVKRTTSQPSIGG